MKKFKSINIARLQTLETIQGTSTPASDPGTRTGIDKRFNSGRVNTNWVVYNIMKICTTIILVLIFSVQVFMDHNECLSKQAHNITDKFQFTFLAGLAFSIIDIGVTVTVAFMKLCVCRESRQFGRASSCKSTLLQLFCFIQYILDALALVFILHSYSIITSKTG